MLSFDEFQSFEDGCNTQHGRLQGMQAMIRGKGVNMDEIQNGTSTLC